MSDSGLLVQLRRVIVGTPIPSRLAHHERLSRPTGLAVFSSDALSSVAYATEEILRVLVVGGVAALAYAGPIAFLIATLLAVVVISYRQTIHAYPAGGGAYTVAKDNLGPGAGLVAAAALLIDYTLTVAVSVAAGVAAIASAVPALHDHRVALSLLFLAVLATGNLRGVRESGRIFAVPTYFFIGTILALIAVGAWRSATGAIPAVPPAGPIPPDATHLLGMFALLTAFANGCTAMTGIEAVTDGVPAFRPPEARNAAATLLTMAALAITMFVGITLLANAYHVVPTDRETVVSQLARGVLGGRGPGYYTVQVATMLILVFAANTAFADFPRLASIVARDRYLPRQFTNQGDRLAFSNGILVLSVAAGLLLLIFRGDTHALIPLYMIGVFVSFTLSQSGMVVRLRRLRPRGWRIQAAVNGTGGALTALVLVVVAVTKAAEGAWIVLVLMPVVMLVFRETRRHYDQAAAQLSLREWRPPRLRYNTVVVPIGGVHRAVAQALAYARTLSPDVRAIYVNIDQRATEDVRSNWEAWGQGIRLVVLESPYRSLMEPLLEYLEQVSDERPDDYLTVILPEFIPARWWQHLLHNQSALLIKGALLFKPNVIVTSVPFHLER